MNAHTLSLSLSEDTHLLFDQLMSAVLARCVSGFLSLRVWHQVLEQHSPACACVCVRDPSVVSCAEPADSVCVCVYSQHGGLSLVCTQLWCSLALYCISVCCEVMDQHYSYIRISQGAVLVSSSFFILELKPRCGKSKLLHCAHFLDSKHMTE